METTRRSFVGLAGAFVSWVAARVGAARPVTSSTPTPAPSPTATPTPSPAAEALVRAARARYGSFLTEEESKMLDERIVALERRSARLKTYALKNSEEPATEFRVTR